MNEKYIKLAIVELDKSGESSFKKTYKIEGINNGYAVIIEKIEKHMMLESISKENFTTISALPSGTSCGCCNGSGRSS